MSVKYQIFVSSTYDDLIKERDQVIKAALEMGHIPVGMEMFSAADEQQWKIITRQIDQSDYYVVIVAHRYGSVFDGLSYTEKEYDYAVSKGIPVIGFIIDESVSWPPEMVDKEDGKRKSLEKFKAKLKNKPVGFWKNSEDLHGKFSIALMKLITSNPRPGWARADEIVGPEVMKELTRLSAENATLREKLNSALEKEKEHEKNINKEIVDVLARNKVHICAMREVGNEWTDRGYATLLNIFTYIAPIIISEGSTVSIAKQIGLSHFNLANTRHDFPVPKNYVEQWLSDLACLKLVKPSDRKHSVHDNNEYWSLTPLGLEVHSDLRRLVLTSATGSTDKTEEPKNE